MKNLYFLLISICYFLCCTALGAQCDYFTLIKDGKVKLENRNYRGAINDYLAAVDCENRPRFDATINQLIKAAQDAWVAELEREKTRAKEAEVQARQEKNAAETAKKAEEVQRQRAEENARIAERNEAIARAQGKKAEGLRLALLADGERSKSNKTNALVLSFLALQLLDTSNQLEVERSFGAAIVDSFSQVIQQFPASVKDAKLLQAQATLLSFSEAQVGLTSLKTLEHKTILLPKKDQAYPSVLAPNGQLMLSFYPNGAFDLWSAEGVLQKHMEAHQDSILSVQFSPNSNFFITCSRDNTAKLWNTQGEVLAVLSGHTGNVYGAQFSPDQEHLLTRSSDGTVKVWNKAGALLSTIEPQSIYVYGASFSAKGNSVLTCGADASLKLWSLQGELLATMQGHRAPVLHTLFSPNQEQIASISLDQTVKLWNSKGQYLTEIKHTPNTPVCFNANHDLIASTTSKGRIMLWNKQGQLLQNLDGHRQAITFLQFSPDGSQLLSTSKDGTSRLWTTDGRILLELPLNTTAPLPSSFSEDGRYLLFFRDNNTTLQKCPTPSTAYIQLHQNLGSIKPLVNQLKNKYEILFWE
jgi:WD40 repeat protein